MVTMLVDVVSCGKDKGCCREQIDHAEVADEGCVQNRNRMDVCGHNIKEWCRSHWLERLETTQENRADPVSRQKESGPTPCLTAQGQSAQLTTS